MTSTGGREDRIPRRATRAILMLLAAGLSVGLLVGCGKAADTTGDHSPPVLEESGSIGPGDTRDPDHAGLPYDAYEFDAEIGDVVVVEVGADGFVPLLKLVEVATGAVLAEWEERYSDDDALTYTIAGSGKYEARVYGLESGSGTYTLTVRFGL